MKHYQTEVLSGVTAQRLECYYTRGRRSGAYLACQRLHLSRRKLS